MGQGYALSSLSGQATTLLCGLELAGLTGALDSDCVQLALEAALLQAAGLAGKEALGADLMFDPAQSPLEQLERLHAALLPQRLERLLQCSLTLFYSQPELLRPVLPGLQRRLALALRLPPEQLGVALNRFPGQTSTAELAAMVQLLCLQAESAPPASQGRPAAEHSPAELRDILRELEQGSSSQPLEDDTLPERARKFERSVTTGLPPLPPAPPPQDGELLIVYSDGASRGNPGMAASGFCILDELGRLIHEGGKRLGNMTNNQAEYLAVIGALEWIADQLGTDYRLELRMDSQLVQRQLSGEYRIRDSELKELALLAMNRLMQFSEFRLLHVPRAENARADAVANLVLDGGDRN